MLQNKINSMIQQEGLESVIQCVLNKISNTLVFENNGALVELYDSLDKALQKYTDDVAFEFDGIILGNGFEDE